MYNDLCVSIIAILITIGVLFCIVMIILMVTIGWMNLPTPINILFIEAMGL